MHKNCQLILPPRPLASCISGCIVRDTRGTVMSDADRISYFPASPLFTVTLTLSGQLHTVSEILGLEDLRKQPSAPNRLVLPPQDRPQMGWSAGPVLALTIAFFPDAWRRLSGSFDATPPERILGALSLLETAPLETAWPKFWAEMSRVWGENDNSDSSANWAGSDRIKDWTYHLTNRLAQTGAGRGLRSAQRRLLKWTGLNRQTLEFFAKVEEVHRLTTGEPTTTPADLAAQAGYADQSHMGRALKRATGFSTVRLNQRIATEEPFWCYRLLAERF